MTSSPLVIENRSEGVPRLAIFKKSAPASQGLIVWQVVTPPFQGTCEVEFPDLFEVYVSLGQGPLEGPRTVSVQVSGAGTVEVCVSESDYGPRLRVPEGEARPHELHIANIYSYDLWAHVLLRGAHAYPPLRVPAGETLIVDTRPSFLVGQVRDFVQRGSRLMEAELSRELVEVRPGQSVRVTGSRARGFQLKVA